MNESIKKGLRIAYAFVHGKMQLTQSTAALTLWPFLTKQTDFKPTVHFYLPMLRRGPAHSLAIAMEAPESK